MKQILLFICLVISFITKAQAISQFQLNFETASAEIYGKDATVIENALEELSLPFAAYHVEIIGHTDNVGGLGYNKTLSTNRAKTISDYLKSKGFDPAKITASAKAYLQPIASNASEEGKSKNRRVTVSIFFPSKVTDIGGLKLREEIYTIDASNPKTLEYKSGTKIRIPADAFVDKNGTPVSGNIDVSYIEYRDPIDFILSNIPMDFTIGGETTHFNSAGMCKILASKNGEPVYLRDNNEIKIDFKLTQEIPNLNFYNFDTIANKWTELSKLTGSGNIGFGANDVIEEFDYNAALCNFDDCAVVYPLSKKGVDFTTSSAYGLFLAEEKRNDSIARFNHLQDSVSLIKMRLEDPERAEKVSKLMDSINQNFMKIKALDAEIAKKAPYYKVRKISNKEEQMTIQIRYKAIRNIVTVDFSNTYWTYDIKQNPQLGESFFKTKWDVCFIKLVNNKCTIQFMDKSSMVTLTGVTLINSNIQKSEEQELINAMNSGPEIQKKKKSKPATLKTKLLNQNIRYNKLIAAYEAGYDYSLTGKKIYNNNPVMRCFFEKSKQYMQPEELTMTAQEWYQYFDLNKEMMANRYRTLQISEPCRQAELKRQQLFKEQEEQRQKEAIITNNASQLTQTLNISSLGIFNCDQISRLGEPLIVDADYLDDKGNTLNPVMIYLINSRINGILCYNGYNGYSPMHFAYGKTSDNTILAFDSDGNSYVINASDFRKSTNGKSGKITLRMKKIADIKNKEQLLAMF